MARNKVRGKPKGKMTAYSFFVKGLRDEVKKQRPKTVISLGKFSKSCSKRWKLLSAEQKALFQKEADEDKKRYNDEMSSFIPEEAEKKEKVLKTGQRKDPSKLKRRKDPSKPKRPLSGFVRFCKDERRKVSERNPNKTTFGEVSKELALMWANLDPQTKERYNLICEKDKERYQKEKELLEAKKNTVTEDPVPIVTDKTEDCVDSDATVDVDAGNDVDETAALSSTTAALGSTTAALSSTTAALSSTTAALSSTTEALSSTTEAALSSTTEAALSSTTEAALSSTTEATNNPVKPKRPVSGFMWFCRDERHKVRERFPKKTTVGEVSKELARMWAKLDPQTKERYNLICEKDKERYYKEKELFEANKNTLMKDLVPKVMEKTEDPDDLSLDGDDKVDETTNKDPVPTDEIEESDSIEKVEETVNKDPVPIDKTEESDSIEKVEETVNKDPVQTEESESIEKVGETANEDSSSEASKEEQVSDSDSFDLLDPYDDWVET